MRIYCDLQAVQSPHNADRGIGRYVTEYARAAEQNHPGAVDGWVLNPNLPTPLQLVSLMHTGTVRSSDDRGLAVPDVWHVLSPFESSSPGLSLDEVWPAWARSRRTRLVVTLYDLIPLIYPDRYLADDETRRAYHARLQLIERADRVLAISEATANDGVRLLGIPARKIDVVGTGVSEHFVVADDVEVVREQLRAELPALRPGYVLYTGGIDFRKNLDGLLTAYARLPEPVRREHQLVIVCRVQQSEREHLEQRARALGVDEDFLLTGYVPDDQLLRVYQAAHLFVFPSMYEGFGLPVVEALSCGVPTIVGSNSSLVELVTDPAAWFDASVVDDITRAMFRALTDDEFRDSLRQGASDHDYRWNVVAERSLTAYEAAVAAPGRRERSRDRIALVSPMPPAASGVADYSAHLLRALAAHTDVDVFTNPDARQEPIPGVRWFSYAELDAAVRVYGRYDQHVVAMGNSDHHLECLDLLRRHGGVVIAHDIRYTGLFGVVERDAPALADAASSETLRAQRDGQLPPRFAHYGQLAASDFYRINDVLLAPVAAAADTVFVHSTTAQALARLNLSPDERTKVELLPFGMVARPRPDGVEPDTIVSFGIVDRMKRSDVALAAFLELARRDETLRFALVGECFDTTLQGELEAMVAESGLGDRVTLAGRVDDTTYSAWLARAKVAVQLRAHTNGESSAAVADCLGAGVPTLVTQLGAMAELGDAAVQVRADAEAVQVADAVAALLADPDELAAQAQRGLDHARSRTFEASAVALLASIAARRA